jgi:hypothetical protein
MAGISSESEMLASMESYILLIGFFLGNLFF